MCKYGKYNFQWWDDDAHLWTFSQILLENMDSEITHTYLSNTCDSPKWTCDVDLSHGLRSTNCNITKLPVGKLAKFLYYPRLETGAIFQQGCNLCCSNAIICCAYFRVRWNGEGDWKPWPPQSPDILPDHCFFGYVGQMEANSVTFEMFLFVDLHWTWLRCHRHFQYETY